ncbi:MAG: hypothetical protein DMD82_03200 [Candidatus Rokuibacteriota bacterium]|nr:MAG: hypothetical protein DMD82_03200 [Candidatus Rokubacteria bacterium]
MPLGLSHHLEETAKFPGFDPAAHASLNQSCDLAFRNSHSYGFDGLRPDERLRLGREVGGLKRPGEKLAPASRLLGDRPAAQRNSQDEGHQ